MVVFTCYHCGDSIQKPKVEKHINIECKKKFLNPRLSCIDCLKDFNRETFIEHTRCVTEEERYSAKGFVPKPSSNKNERKQQSWVEIIQAASRKPELNEFQRKFLKALSNYSNVPRKYKQFKNFINSSLKHLNVNNSTIDEVFKFIDDEYKSSLPTNPVTKPAQKTDTVDSQQPDKSEVEKNDVEPSDKPTREKKNKKNKLKEIEITSIPEKTSAETTNLDETAAKEVNEHTQNKKENVENQDVTISKSAINENLDESAAFEVVKKKKKSKKNNVGTENVNVEVDNEENIPKGENLKRSLENDIDQDIPVKGVSKKKLKKLKLQEVQENSPDDSQLNQTINAEPGSNEIVSEVILPKESECTEKMEISENFTKKQRKELKKKLKYAAELKAVETEAVQLDAADNQETQTDENQKRDKKKKRKLTENIENEEVATKKKKHTENGINQEEIVQCNGSKFSWDQVIREVLEKAEGNEMSLKKLTRKAVTEYQSCHSDQKTYEEVLKKFNKKINKLPFIKILKDKVKLAV